MKTIMMLIILVFSVVPDSEVYAQENKTASSQADTTTQVDDISTYSRPMPVYNSGGKRDPFNSLVPTPIDEEKQIKELFNYEEARLIGIVKTSNDIYALVTDKSGMSYVLREGYMVYGGYVTRITENSVFLHIVKYGRAMSIILRLESAKSTIITEYDGEQVIKKPGIIITYEKSARPHRNIMIEDIIVPSTDTKTLEEQWHGKKSSLPDVEGASGISQKAVSGSFSLYNPPDDSWIRMPHVLKWTSYEGEEITYILYIDDSPDFEAPLVLSEKIDSSSYLLIDDMGLPPNRELFWKVIALDKFGNEQPCRQKYLSFKIIGNK